MNLTELIKRSHDTAVDKGFYEITENFINIAKQHAPDQVEMFTQLEVIKRLDLIHGELGEALEALRHGHMGLEEKDTFEDEIADAFIRLFDMCGWMKIDIEKQIEWKMNYNKGREKLHGKKF